MKQRKQDKHVKRQGDPRPPSNSIQIVSRPRPPRRRSQMTHNYSIRNNKAWGNGGPSVTQDSGLRIPDSGLGTCDLQAHISIDGQFGERPKGGKNGEATRHLEKLGGVLIEILGIVYLVVELLEVW